jgi:hypothetical protein
MNEGEEVEGWEVNEEGGEVALLASSYCFYFVRTGHYADKEASHQ